jgi:hypothetical protein
MSKGLFAGSRTDCVTQVSGTISDNDNPNWVDPAYCDAGIRVTAAVARGTLTDPAHAPLLVPYAVEAGNTFYFHAEYAWNDRGYHDDFTALTLQDNTGVSWVRLSYNGQLQFNSGTAGAPVWTNIGAQVGPIGNYYAPRSLDIALSIAADGDHTILLAFAGAAVVPVTPFIQPLLTNIGQFLLSGDPLGHTDDCWSQIMCTENISTINGHVYTKRPVSAGTYSEWTGTYTDVNEVVTNDATSNTAATAGLRQSYPVGTIVIPDGYEVIGVYNWLRGKNSGADPANVQALVRTAADVDHTSADLPGINVTFEQFGASYPVNPDTGLAWVPADWAAVNEFGFVSGA